MTVVLKIRTLKLPNAYSELPRTALSRATRRIGFVRRCTNAAHIVAIVLPPLVLQACQQAPANHPYGNHAANICIFVSNDLLAYADHIKQFVYEAVSDKNILLNDDSCLGTSIHINNFTFGHTPGLVSEIDVSNIAPQVRTIVGDHHFRITTRIGRFMYLSGPKKNNPLRRYSVNAISKCETTVRLLSTEERPYPDGVTCDRTKNGTTASHCFVAIRKHVDEIAKAKIDECVSLSLRN